MTKNERNQHTSHHFSVSLSYASCEDLYRQQIKFLLVTSAQGLRIRLPKQNMQRFITPLGLQGQFELIVDQNNKIISIKRVSSR